MITVGIRNIIKREGKKKIKMLSQPSVTVMLLMVRPKREPTTTATRTRTIGMSTAATPFSSKKK